MTINSVFSTWNFFEVLKAQFSVFQYGRVGVACVRLEDSVMPWLGLVKFNFLMHKSPCSSRDLVSLQDSVPSRENPVVSSGALLSIICSPWKSSSSDLKYARYVFFSSSTALIKCTVGAQHKWVPNFCSPALCN